MFRFTNFILLELTLDCNLRCRYCYLREKDSYAGQTMSYETFCSVIDTIIQQRMLTYRRSKKVEILFHGGEPTLVGEDLLEKFFSYAKEKLQEANLPYQLVIQTNATRITPRLARLLKQYDVSLGISLDGMGDKNTLRANGASAQKKILEGIEILKQENVPFGMLTVVTKHNIDTVNELAEIHPLRKNKALLVVDTSSPEEDRLEPSQAEWFSRIVEPTLKNLISETKASPAMDFTLSVERELKRAVMDIISYHSDSCQSTCGIKFCGSGTTIVSVQPDGTVNACDRWDTKYNDVARVMHHGDFDFCGIRQLQRAVHFMLAKDVVVRSAGCDTCYASYICMGQCESLYYSRYGTYGIDKKNICEGIKKIYDFAIENLDAILEHYYRKNNGVLKFEEDRLLELKVQNIRSLKYEMEIDLTDNHNLILTKKDKRNV